MENHTSPSEMTYRERMLRFFESGDPQGMIFAPRMDLWYIANRQRGTLPDNLKGLDLPGLAEVFGCGCHALKADLTLARDIQDFTLLGLGLENHNHYPFRFVWDDLDVKFTSPEEGKLKTVVHTPKGELCIDMEFTEKMLANGISMPFVHRYPLQEAGDIEALRYVFERISVVPAPEGFQRFEQHLGETGLPVASGMPGASPMHHILHNLTNIETFFYLYHDNYEQIQNLALAIQPLYEATLDAVLKSRAKLFYWGSNYDWQITNPPFFEQEIAPWLSHAAQGAHNNGQSLLTHADGDNGPLLDLFFKCGVDVLESVCTEPMIPISMRELREKTAGKSIVWGGIPSVMLLRDQCTDAEFDNFLDEFIAQVDGASHCLIGVSDNVPPDADMDRFEKICSRFR